MAMEELNAHLSMVKAIWHEDQHKITNATYEWFSLGVIINEIQDTINSIIDNFFNPAWIKKIELQINKFDSLTPPYPSSNKLCASVQIAKAVCFRVESQMSNPDCDSHIYINRLNTYLLKLSRFVECKKIPSKV